MHGVGYAVDDYNRQLIPPETIQEVEAAKQNTRVVRRLGTLRRNLCKQRLTVGQLSGIRYLPARGHHVTEATGGVVDAAGL